MELCFGFFPITALRQKLTALISAGTQTTIQMPSGVKRILIKSWENMRGHWAVMSLLFSTKSESWWNTVISFGCCFFLLVGWGNEGKWRSTDFKYHFVDLINYKLWFYLWLGAFLPTSYSLSSLRMTWTESWPLPICNARYTSQSRGKWSYRTKYQDIVRSTTISKENKLAYGF